MKPRGRILVTGAVGFVGRHLIAHLNKHAYSVLATDRLAVEAGFQAPFAQLELAPDTQWEHLLEGCDAVVHLAARAHVMKEQAVDPMAEFRRINVEGTRRLAEASRKAGVRRFVLASSIGVYGDVPPLEGFSESCPLSPCQAYAVSKVEAEQVIQEIFQGSTTEYTIVRPSLVYGPGVPGNFFRLLRLIHSAWPLPFRGVANRRSFLAIQNLVSMLENSLFHPAAAGHAFNLADPASISTETLVRHLAAGMGKSPRLFRAPHALVRWIPPRSKMQRIHGQLFGDLHVNSEKIQSLLGWTPAVESAEALQATGRWFHEAHC